MIQSLQDRGVLSGAAMRYRARGQERWRAAEAVEIKGPELTLLCDVPLEVHDEVEILLPANVQFMGRESPLTLRCAGPVVRRVLANWPEVRSLLVVSLAECRIAGAADYRGGAAVCGERGRR